jgi:G3E family GTPase
LEPADVICISKTDLVDEDELAEVERSVREVNATAPIVRMDAQGPANPSELDKLMGE